MQRDRRMITFLIKCLPYMVILLMGVLIFLKPLGNGDELWNYNFARNVAQGNVPYRDFSIVQTPLSSYLSAFFLWILGDGLFVFRIAAYILFVSIAIVFFCFCISVTKSKPMAMCATIFVMSAHFLWFIYNYNYLSVLVLLIILMLERRSKHKLCNDIIIGLLVGICILIKQNTGVFIWLANLIISLRRAKSDHCIKNSLIRVSISLVPIAVFVAYLLLSGSFYDFWDYAVIGISTFTHRYSIADFFADSAFFVPYLMLILAIYIMLGIKLVNRKVNDYQFSVIIFSLAWASVAYPLADVSHVLLIVFPLIPALFSCYSYERMKRKEAIYSFMLSFSVILLAITIKMPFDIGFNVSKLENFRGVLIDENWESVIQRVDDYIIQKEKEGYVVRIADANAAVFKIPLDKYEKNWDMLLVGNLGSNSIQDLVQTNGSTIYLVLNHERSYGLQDHYELIDYIKSNFSCVDEISGFYVYEGK